MTVQRRIARRLGELRAERGWSLATLAAKSGISRATLSRIERAELSPTAAMLGTLGTLYGRTLSRLMAEAEGRPVTLVRAAEQAEWKDPASGYRRRMVSPPSAGRRAELVEVRIPARRRVEFATPPLAGLEHHLWMLDGALTIEVDGTARQLAAGDCLRYAPTGATRFVAGAKAARYLVVLVHP